MFKYVLDLFGWFNALFRSRNNLGLEIVALRQRVSVLKHQNPWPRLRRWDQLFWVFLRRGWSRWTKVPPAVKPEAVVRWHRAGFWLLKPCLAERSGGLNGDRTILIG
jgi:hypothetical protein